MGENNYRLAFVVMAVFMMCGCRDTHAPADPETPAAPTACQVDSGWGSGKNDTKLVSRAEHMLAEHSVTIAVCGWDECDSLLYPNTHATFDILGPGGLGNRVVIQLPD